MTAPDGEPVFGEAPPRERYFHGPYADRAVDVVTIPNGFQHFHSAQSSEEYFAETTEPWNHEIDGVFLTSGDGIDASRSLEDPHLFDVAPTILSALGVPRSDRMDGRVLPIVEATEVRSHPEYAPAEGDAVDATVEGRLADLGYVE